MRSKRARAAIVAVLCVAAGAVAGIAGSAAAPSKAKPRAGGRAIPGAPGFMHHGHRWRFGGHGPVVHEDAVVLDKAGKAFITRTEDNGTVDSVSGDQLSIKEAIGSVTYKTVTLTIPSGATIYRNFAKAQLSDLKAGDRVHVTQSSDGTFVLAGDGSARPPRFFGRPGAPGPGPAPGMAPGYGPPPGLQAQ